MRLTKCPVRDMLGRLAHGAMLGRMATIRMSAYPSLIHHKPSVRASIKTMERFLDVRRVADMWQSSRFRRTHDKPCGEKCRISSCRWRVSFLGAGSEIRGAGFETRQDPAERNPCSDVNKTFMLRPRPIHPISVSKAFKLTHH